MDKSKCRFFQPCRLIIRKIEVDFSEMAKAKIASIINRKNISKIPHQQREIILYNITQIQNLISTENLKFAAPNLQDMLEKIEMMNDYELLSSQQKSFLISILNKLNATQDAESNKFSNFIIKSLNNTLEKVKIKLNEKFKNVEYQQQYEHWLQLESLLHEAESEQILIKIL